MNVKNQWPKMLRAADYADRWYVGRTKEAVIGNIKDGTLPGAQDDKGFWYVWVNADLTPAYGYEGPIKAPHEQSGTGNSVADNAITSFARRAS